MKIFLILFQSDDEDVRNQLVERIKGLGSWARISNSAWCIKSDCKNTVDIRDSLKSLLTNNNERLMVLNITDSAWASYYIPKEVTTWLKETT